jgi:hypothetical protein
MAYRHSLLDSLRNRIPSFALDRVVAKDPMTLATLSTVSSALLTPVVALLAMYIAYRQWRTAQNKLKLDLFERRVAIYEAAQSYVHHCRHEQRIDAIIEQAFADRTSGAKWLLNDEVAHRLRLLPRQLQDLVMVRRDPAFPEMYDAMSAFHE